MAVTRGRSTYEEIADDVRFDANTSKLSGLSDLGAFKNWILRAEEHICDLVDVEEEYVLRLITDVDRYQVQDRPVITAATTATPIVVTTASAHDLASADIFFVTGIVGLTGGNGRLRAKSVTSTTITLQLFSRVTDATNASPIVITSADHPYVTSDVVAITQVLGNTAANGTFTITKIDKDSFSLDGSTGNGNYESGGIAIKDTVGVGTYTSGGRFWKEDDVPSFFKNFKSAERIWSNQITRPLNIVSIDDILNEAVEDDIASYSSYSAPFMMAQGKLNLEEYLRFYPPPKENGDVTLYGVLRIVPREYFEDPISTTIHLNTRYDNMIKAFVRSQAFRRVKEHELAGEENDLFYDLVTQFNQRQPFAAHRRISYQ